MSDSKYQAKPTSSNDNTITSKNVSAEGDKTPLDKNADEYLYEVEKEEPDIWEGLNPDDESWDGKRGSNTKPTIGIKKGNVKK